MKNSFKMRLGIFALLTAISANICGQKGQTFLISFDTLSLSSNQPQDTLDIMVSTNGRPFGGADLKFGFDSPAFQIVTILQGEISDSCGWKVFNSRQAIESGKEGFPRSMWQLLVMAEFGPDSLRPVCYSFERPVSLARLVVVLDTAQIKMPISDSIVPIYFFWEDCSDNTVTNVKGDSLFISESVDKRYWSDQMVLEARFPTRLGAVSKCVNARVKYPPVRKIGFNSGGIRLNSVVEKNPALE